MSFSVRPFETDDWKIFKDMRLKALVNHPHAYGGKYEDALANTDDQWKELVDGRRKRIFGLFNEAALIGIASIFTWEKDPSGETGLLGMDYVEPDYRGRHLIDMLYKARIAWAKTQPSFKQLIIAHREDNTESKNAIQRNNFTFWEKRMELWPDGVNSYSYLYKLEL